MNAALEGSDATEENIQATIDANPGMDRSAVLTEIRRRFEDGGS